MTQSPWTFRSFAANPVVVRSVLYSVSVIDEASKHLSDEFKLARADIPWRAIASMRDRVVHEYFPYQRKSDPGTS